MLRVELQPAFILHQRPFRDTSALLEVFSREHGRIGLVARGVRGPRSRLRGVLQPFRPLLLSWQQRGELGTLTAAELEGAAGVTPAGGDALLALYYLNELLLRLTGRMDPHRALYAEYAATVATLLAGAPVAPRLRRFEVRLLDELGYGLDLRRDATGDPVTPESSYRFDPAQGLFPCPEGASGAFPGAVLLALADDGLEGPAALAAARRLLRAALDAHLDGRPLKTRELLARSRRGSGGS